MSISLFLDSVTEKHYFDGMTDYSCDVSISNYPAALGPGVYSASNSDDYQKQKNIVSGK
jgi:hypothetical protein